MYSLQAIFYHILQTILYSPNQLTSLSNISPTITNIPKNSWIWFVGMFYFFTYLFLFVSIHRANHMQTILVCNVNFAVCIANVLFAMPTCGLQYCLQRCLKPMQIYHAKYKPDLLDISQSQLGYHIMCWMLTL